MGLEKLNSQKFHMKQNAKIQIHRAPDNLQDADPNCWKNCLCLSVFLSPTSFLTQHNKITMYQHGIFVNKMTFVP